MTSRRAMQVTGFQFFFFIRKNRPRVRARGISLGKTANVPGLVENTGIVIDFDDSIIEDKQTERAEDRKDVSMGVMGLPEYRAKWYGETEEVAATKLPDQSAGVLM